MTARSFPKLFPLAALLLALPALALTPAAATPTDSAYIYSTGNAQSPAFRVYVGADGRVASASLLGRGRVGQRRRGRLIAATRRRFFADLRAAGGLQALPHSPLPRTGPADDAPGVRIGVRYRGQTSPDLRGAGSPAGQRLYQDVKQVMQVLRLPIPNVP